MIRFKEHYSLKSYNTFGIEAKSRYFFEFTELEDLQIFQQSNESLANEPVLLLGGGSNLLFAHDFEGVVIHANVPGIRVVNEDRNHIWIEVGAGEDWDAFVDYCVRNEYFGLENLSLIPGNVGSAPVQNIGAYGVEVQEFVETVKGYDLQSRQEYLISASECRFAYRDSIFKHELKNRFVVCSVVFRLEKFPAFKLDYGHLKAEVDELGKTTVQNVRKAVIAIRESKLPDPAEVGNAGSFFKNPVIQSEQADALKKQFDHIPLYPAADGLVKVAAGWLIEQCGWKGFREGDAGVHDKQALVLVNYGHASGEQIVQLSEKIQQSVFETFGVQLEREVHVI